MSYDAYFKQNGKTVTLAAPHSLAGGTYVRGGTRDAWLNITYNYSPWFCEAWPPNGVNHLDGKTAAEVAAAIRAALPVVTASKLPERVCSCDGIMACYWAATRENAESALRDLLQLAEMAPSDAVLEIR